MRALTPMAAAVLSLTGLALGAPAPAEALSYGGWTARTSLDTYYNDNLTRGVVVPTTALPYGNQDLGLNVGLSIGNVFVITPEIDTWVIADLHGRAGLLYPSLSGAWGSLFANTIWHLEGGREAYVLLGSTLFWGAGSYHAGEVGFVQPLWAGASGRLQAGGGTYQANTATDSFNMPSVGAGLDQAFVTGTTVGVRYAYQTLMYTASTDPRHQVYGYATQRLGGSFEVHALYLRTLNYSATSPYSESYFGAGVGYDF